MENTAALVREYIWHHNSGEYYTIYNIILSRIIVFM